MYRNAVRGGPIHQASAITGNVYKNLAKFGRVFLELCERTDKQTDILITILFRTPPVGEVMGQDEWWLNAAKCQARLQHVHVTGTVLYNTIFV